MCLIELIKVDLEYRWIHYDFPKRLADYRAEYDELRSGPSPPDLAYEEFHALLRSGRSPGVGAPRHRPDQWLCLAGVLGFLGDYWLFRQLEADLRAFERAVTHPPGFPLSAVSAAAVTR
ncbi:hypothetical protein [Nocardia sp. NBC_01388]|uniref:hypothetical protein n=1 Tax=Nocardia sp. NBC_01388 TaxID=2903596 RepID=UPI00324DEC97